MGDSSSLSSLSSSDGGGDDAETTNGEDTVIAPAMKCSTGELVDTTKSNDFEEEK